MRKQLVLLGGGHAHMTVLSRLKEFTAICQSVTLVQPSPYHYYSGMGAGLLGGMYRPDELRFNTRKRVEASGAVFRCDRAAAIDPVRQAVVLESGDELEYDLLSCNVGSSVAVNELSIEPGSDSGDTVFPVKPIEGLREARQKILSSLEKGRVAVAVIGGGPSAIEIAGNLVQLGCGYGGAELHVDLFCGKGFMADTSPRLQAQAKHILDGKGVNIHRGNYVKSLAGTSLVLDDDTVHYADFIFIASGIIPSPLFHDSDLVTGPDGGLLVNSYLQSVEYGNIFGGGDCISFQPRPLDKVGVYAVRQNEVLYRNLKAFLAKEELRPFKPGGDYLLIYNLGGGEGILSKWEISIKGKLPFLVKDLIDRRFVKKFKMAD